MTTAKQRLFVTVGAAAILAIGFLLAKENARKSHDAQKGTAPNTPPKENLH